jgi:hypothetical protein
MYSSYVCGPLLRIFPQMDCIHPSLFGYGIFYEPIDRQTLQAKGYSRHQKCFFVSAAVGSMMTIPTSPVAAR